MSLFWNVLCWNFFLIGHYFFKHFFCFPPFYSSLQTPVTHVVGHLKICSRSLIIKSCSLFCPVLFWVVLITMSSPTLFFYNDQICHQGHPMAHHRPGSRAWSTRWAAIGAEKSQGCQNWAARWTWTDLTTDQAGWGEPQAGCWAMQHAHRRTDTWVTGWHQKYQRGKEKK